MNNNSSSNNSSNGEYGNSDRIESPSATYFDPQEAPPGQRSKFKRLWRYNEDLQKHNTTQCDEKEVWRRERIRRFDVLVSRLPLTELQEKRARSMLERLDFDDYHEGRYLTLETYFFVLCVMIYNEIPGKSERKYLPSESRDNPERFDNVADDYGIEFHQIKQGFDELYGEFYNR
jgi:hypothetical protein